MPRGSSIIEAAVAIAVMASLIAVVVGFANGVRLNRASAYTAQATEVGQAELEALRTVPYGALVTQTSGPPIGRFERFGNWAVVADASAPSAPNALDLTPPTSATSGRTGTLVVPTLATGDGTVSASVLPEAGSPSGWTVGFYVRALDAGNGYRAWFSATQIALEKMANGTTTTLFSAPGTFNPGTWQALDLDLTGGTLVLKMNGATLATITDSTYTQGAVALFGTNGVLARFDNVAVPTATFAFDTDPVGSLPSAWLRLSANDLPDATPTVPDDNVQITIGDQIAGDGDLLKLTAAVSWLERGATHTLTLSTLRAKFGVFLF